MRAKYLHFLLVPFFLLLLQACHHRMVPVSKSAIIYDQPTDRTRYSEDPFGTVSIKGKWDAGKYNKASHQQYFYHKDTATLIVSIGVCSAFPFAKNGLSGYDFVKKYFDVEAKYQAMLEQKANLLVEDEANKYMIWVVRQDGIDQYFLCGAKDCSCNEPVYNAITLKSRKYDAEKAKAFLKETFMAL
jgi:hypothetical protein